MWFDRDGLVTPDEAALIDDSLRRFGVELRHVGRTARVVLPTDEFFPGVYTASEDDVHTVIGRMCGLAHELAHVRLPEEYPGDPWPADVEQRADLLTVYLGLGVFTANAAREYYKRGDTHRTSFRADRRGSLTEEMYGYALARYLLSREESDPPWLRHLDTNPRTYLKRALRQFADDE